MLGSSPNAHKNAGLATLIIAILALGALGGLTLVHAPTGAKAPTAGVGLAPDVCSGGCGGTETTVSILVDISGAPQTVDGYTVYVPVNLVFEAGTSPIVTDQNDIAVKNSGSVGFTMENGGTGATGSWNATECASNEPNIGCPLYPIPSSSHAAYEIPSGELILFRDLPYYYNPSSSSYDYVSGCEAANGGWLSYGPGNVKGTITVSYKDCADVSQPNTGPIVCKACYVNVTSDPCPTNGTSASNGCNPSNNQSQLTALSMLGDRFVIPQVSFPVVALALLGAIVGLFLWFRVRGGQGPQGIGLIPSTTPVALPWERRA